MQSLRTLYLNKAALTLGAALFFWQCSERKFEDLGELNTNFASRKVIHADMQMKDSGNLVMHLKAPLIEEYEFIDSPYTVTPKGLQVYFWNKKNKKPNFIRADWAKIKDKQTFYEGRGNVELINNEGDTLQTQHIFWDSKKQEIYTDDTVVIKRANGTVNTAFHGLKASQDFKRFTLFENKGILTFDKENQETLFQKTK